MTRLVALDFEFTSHPDPDQESADNWFSEIVGKCPVYIIVAHNHQNVSIFLEIGAVLFDVARGGIIERFQQFVKPTRHRLSTEFKEQFGFTEAQLEDEPTLDEALVRFEKWFNRNAASNMLSQQKEDPCGWNKRTNVFLCTWSAHDLRDVLPREAKEKKMQYPEFMKKWMDMQRLVKVGHNAIYFEE